LVIFKTGKIVFNEKVAFLAFLGIIFYPPLIAYSLRITPLIFFAFFTTLTVLYIIKVKNEPLLKNLAYCGVLMGITALTEPNIIPFLPFSIGWLFFNLTQSTRIKLKSLFTIVLFGALVITPWVARNYLALDRFILIKSTVGFNLWIGNNPSATGTFYLSNGGIFQESNAELTGIDETQANSTLATDDMFLKAAVSYIRNNPLRTFRLGLTKLYYFWWYPAEKLLSPAAARLMKFMKVPYGILLFNSILCICFLRSKVKEINLFIFLFFSFSLTHAIFLVGHPRYRTPIEIYLILLASQAFFHAKEKFSLFRYRSL
jgi:4-amino-4-deoxy-L-arabinose transferase-like glycosyltransferase